MIFGIFAILTPLKITSVDYEALMKLRRVPSLKALPARPGNQNSISNRTLSNTMNNRIEHLRELLGPVVLLPWPAGSKGGRRKWHHFQLTHMNDARHLARLEKAGNIGVALGKVSDGLVTIDVDSDEHVAPLLGLNPGLAKTLRTSACRGSNIWLRCVGEYPASCNLSDSSGNPIGEWRADGNQTIVAGTHPLGMPYRFIVEAPVVPITYQDIVWPQGFSSPQRAMLGEPTERSLNRVTEVTELQSNRSCLLRSLFAKAVESASTTDFHQNDSAIFRLGRAMIDIEYETGTYPTPDELKDVFRLWAERNRRFWRQGQSWNDYWIDFLQACEDARYGLTENPLDSAWRRALSVRPSEEATRYFDDPKMHLFVSLLGELQILNGNKPIYASTRAIAERFDISNVTAAKWIKALIPLEILELTERGTATRCPRYFYTPLNTARVTDVSRRSRDE